jgi:chemotaxis protein methyltransferase CheR
MTVTDTRVSGPAIASEDMAYTFFLRQVKRLAGIDLSAYKSQQMKRRLNTVLARNKVANLFEYSKLLENPDRLQEFMDFFTINVSEFFRIPDKFEYLATRIIPGLMARGGELRIWSAGCSNGAEPYSLAIMMDEIAPSGRWTILASDVDRTTLARAQRGNNYSPGDLRNVSPQRLSRYFEPDGAGYRVKETLKRRVRFTVHDLLKDRYEPGFRLIVCRHVVIYFTEEAKDAIYGKFWSSLEDGGVLFLGGTEIIPQVRGTGFESAAVSFYRKTERRG